MQLVLFEIGSERFGLDLVQVKEIIRDLPVTPVPGAPEAIDGVTNLRGRVLPVVNLRRRFAISEPRDDHTETRIIVLEKDDELIGYRVDRVHRVLRVDFSRILPYDGKSRASYHECIRGIFKMDTGIIVVLELDRLHEFAVPRP